jgi:hypothetical protein
MTCPYFLAEVRNHFTVSIAGSIGLNVGLLRNTKTSLCVILCWCLVSSSSSSSPSLSDTRITLVIFLEKVREFLEQFGFNRGKKRGGMEERKTKVNNRRRKQKKCFKQKRRRKKWVNKKWERKERKGRRKERNLNKKATDQCVL